MVGEFVSACVREWVGEAGLSGWAAGGWSFRVEHVDPTAEVSGRFSMLLGAKTSRTWRTP